VITAGEHCLRLEDHDHCRGCLRVLPAGTPVLAVDGYVYCDRACLPPRRSRRPGPARTTVADCDREVG